ncbi:hypothetical protein TNIN_119871 [Trichonephila inaurata madagascariensis]|uniref:Uncharacterized protein n=1 Tax=Trichonephila inaurata madagascariensis TaxID=2747483 RepID=A0A8X6Y0Y4_9ARAC|nr:hypothetical protein TNIN_119871 [Trichonephila inaurata madagascariensis]
MKTCSASFARGRIIFGIEYALMKWVVKRSRYNKMDDLERNRKQKLLDTKRLQFTCGWTSEELGWQREERRRQWGGKTEIGLRNWLADRDRKENSNQSLAEGSLKRYLRELNLAADLTPNLDGCLYSGDAIQTFSTVGWIPLNKSVALLLSFRPTTVSRDSLVLLIGGNWSRSFENDARLPSSVPLLYEECVLLSTPETTGGQNIVIRCFSGVIDVFVSAWGSNDECGWRRRRLEVGHRNLARASPFLLKSEPRRYSATGRQEVTWSQECTGSCLWKILPKPLPCVSQYVTDDDGSRIRGGGLQWSL